MNVKLSNIKLAGILAASKPLNILVTDNPRLFYLLTEWFCERITHEVYKELMFLIMAKNFRDLIYTSSGYVSYLQKNCFIQPPKTYCFLFIRWLMLKLVG